MVCFYVMKSKKKKKNRTSEQTEKRNEAIDTENKQVIARGQ